MLALLEPVADCDVAVDRGHKLVTKVRKLVFDGRRARGQDPALDDAVGGELAQPGREDLGGDAGDVASQLVEAARAFAQVPDDVRRPGPAEQRQALGQRTL